MLSPEQHHQKQQRNDDLIARIHFVNNGFAVICTHIPSLSEYDFWIEMMGRPTYVVVYIAGLAALVLCIMAFKRIPLKAPYGNIDRV